MIRKDNNGSSSDSGRFRLWLKRHPVLIAAVIAVLVLIIALVASGKSLGGSNEVPDPEDSLKSAMDVGEGGSMELTPPDEESDFDGWIDVYYEDSPSNMKEHIVTAISAWGKMNNSYGKYGLTIHFSEENIDSSGTATQEEYGKLVFEAETLAGIDTEDADTLSFGDIADYTEIDGEYEEYVD